MNKNRSRSLIALALALGVAAPLQAVTLFGKHIPGTAVAKDKEKELTVTQLMRKYPKTTLAATTATLIVACPCTRKPMMRQFVVPIARHLHLLATEGWYRNLVMQRRWANLTNLFAYTPFAPNEAEMREMRQIAGQRHEQQMKLVASGDHYHAHEVMRSDAAAGVDSVSSSRDRRISPMPGLSVSIGDGTTSSAATSFDAPPARADGDASVRDSAGTADFLRATGGWRKRASASSSRLSSMH
jgi:hypothetical protein